MKKIIKNAAIIGIISLSLSAGLPNDYFVSAKVINPTKKDHMNSGNNFKKKLGNHVYNVYHSIDSKLNGDTYHYMLTATNKIDFTYYNKYSSIRKFFGTPSNLYVSNETTTNNDVNSAPWENNQRGSLLKRRLFNGRDIYYRINATGKLASLYQAAVKAWNDLGVVQFIPTSSNDENVIQLNGAVNTIPGNNNEDVIGVTHNSAYDDGTMADTSINIRSDVLGADYFEQLSVAEHELGHALGFAHDNESLEGTTELLMNYMNAAEGNNYNNDYAKENLVGALEQHKLMQMYNLDVLPGFYKYAIVNPDTYTG